MLPAHLAENIRKQVLFYLQSTFDFRDKAVDKAFERFLTDPDTGLFKGPWVQLRRPFRPADAGETGSDRLAKFASTLFEEDVDAEAVTCATSGRPCRCTCATDGCRSTTTSRSRRSGR